MGDVIFQGGMKALVEGDLEAAPDIRLMLVMSGFTGEAEEDAITLDEITTIDEFDGIGYLEIDCQSVTFTYDATADEYQLTFDADEWNAPAGTVAPGSDDAIGILVKLYVDGTEANDVAVGFTDTGGFPFNAANGTLAYTPHVDGMIYLKAA